MDRLGVTGAVDRPKGKKSDEELSDEEFEASAVGGPPDMTADAVNVAVSKLDTLTGKLQALERNLLQYADKLGLTPAGRVRLAQKRAQAAADPQPDDDLFGD